MLDRRSLSSRAHRQLGWYDRAANLSRPLSSAFRIRATAPQLGGFVRWRSPPSLFLDCLELPQSSSGLFLFARRNSIASAALCCPGTLYRRIKATTGYRTQKQGVVRCAAADVAEGPTVVRDAFRSTEVGRIARGDGGGTKNGRRTRGDQLLLRGSMRSLPDWARFQLVRSEPALFDNASCRSSLRNAYILLLNHSSSVACFA